MIHSITVTNYQNKELYLELGRPDDSGFLITSVSGLGPVKADISTMELAGFDGAIYNSARMSSREISMGLVFVTEDNSEIPALRRKAYEFFRIKTKLTLKVTDRIIRNGVYSDTDYLIDGYVSQCSVEHFTRQEGAQIAITCPNPYFRYKSYQLTDCSGVTSDFSFPHLFDDEEKTVFSTYFTAAGADIVYYGTVPTGVILFFNIVKETNADLIFSYLHDPTKYFKLSTSKLVKILEGSSYKEGDKLQAGDQVKICTIRGDKYITIVRNGDNKNALSALDLGSTWVELEAGLNSFFWSAISDGVVETDHIFVSVQNPIYFEGI